MGAVSGEDYYLDGVVLRGRVEGVVQFIKEVGVLGVAGLDPVEHDACDAIGGGLKRIYWRFFITVLLA